MHSLGIGLALLVALGIIAIGLWYIARPLVAMRGFGLPPPEEGPAVAWWLRLKGVRDIVSGLVVLAVMAWSGAGTGGTRLLGLVLAVEALIPLGDMLTVLAGRGSARTAFGIHGATALLMAVAVALLLAGAP